MMEKICEKCHGTGLTRRPNGAVKMCDCWTIQAPTPDELDRDPILMLLPTEDDS